MVTNTRALIIDDERLARAELRRLLSRHAEIEIVGEAANAKDARRAILDLEPDVLFVDVQMPGETGFDLLASLDTTPLVVFTTAYDDYALRAFDVSALDYLVKPIDPERLARTVERLLAGMPADDVAAGGTGASPLSEKQRVFLTDGKRAWLVPLGDIRLFESADNYTRVHFGTEAPLINRSLGELESKLDERVFFRANRHQIFNLKAVRSIEHWFGGRLLVRIEGGPDVTLSRRRARAFRERMGV